MLHRRDFFLKVAGLAATARLLPANDEPFDALPASPSTRATPMPKAIMASIARSIRLASTAG